jgi:hypothetical protein
VKAIVILVVLAICALTPALASAATTVPPGATEGDQYSEEVPNGGGSASVDKTGGGAGVSQAVAATQALNALGADGQKAAALANANRPPQQGQPNNSANAQPSSSSSTEGEGGMGSFFPVLLVITALAAIAYGVRRRLNPT